MEKISLLLLIVKKTLIGSVIAGVLGLGNISNVITTIKNENPKEQKRAGLYPGRDVPPKKQ